MSQQNMPVLSDISEDKQKLALMIQPMPRNPEKKAAWIKDIGIIDYFLNGERKKPLEKNKYHNIEKYLDKITELMPKLIEQISYIQYADPEEIIDSEIGNNRLYSTLFDPKYINELVEWDKTNKIYSKSKSRIGADISHSWFDKNRENKEFDRPNRVHVLNGLNSEKSLILLSTIKMLTKTIAKYRPKHPLIKIAQNAENQISYARISYHLDMWTENRQRTNSASGRMFTFPSKERNASSGQFGDLTLKSLYEYVQGGLMPETQREKAKKITTITNPETKINVRGSNLCSWIPINKRGEIDKLNVTNKKESGLDLILHKTSVLEYK